MPHITRISNTTAVLANTTGGRSEGGRSATWQPGRLGRRGGGQCSAGAGPLDRGDGEKTRNPLRFARIPFDALFYGRLIADCRIFQAVGSTVDFGFEIADSSLHLVVVFPAVGAQSSKRMLPYSPDQTVDAVKVTALPLRFHCLATGFPLPLSFGLPLHPFHCLWPAFSLPFQLYFTAFPIVFHCLSTNFPLAFHCH